MSKNIEGFFSYLDKRHTPLGIISFVLTLISGIIYYFVHTYDFGYAFTAENNVLYAFLPPIILAVGLPFILGSGINKRIITSILIIVMSVGILEIPCGLYCAFVGDLPPEAALGIIGYYTAVIIFALYGLKNELKNAFALLKKYFRTK